ncbi:hypothetical protein KA005_09335 [bacterium]|nr:hypothetical protein [bacterium]
MRNYFRQLKPLEECNILKIESSAIQEVPEEVFRMLRARMGIAFAISKGSAYFWQVGEKTRSMLAELEEFSGEYAVGRDAIGYYWMQL